MSSDFKRAGIHRRLWNKLNDIVLSKLRKVTFLNYKFSEHGYGDHAVSGIC